MRILFTGGGTLGPVTPLLAIAQELIDQKESTPNQMHWIGTPSGPERALIESYGIPFSSVQSGKLRRYFSYKNFVDPFFLMTGLIQSIIVLNRFKPDIVIGAGGYVQVPVIGAAWFLKKKSAVLQLDMVPGLANLMCVSMVDKILLSFPEQAKDFPKVKTILTGLPVRQEIRESKKCSDKKKKELGLEPALPTVFITGGGTGAQALNQIVIDSLSRLMQHYNVVHVAGINKAVIAPTLGKHQSRYQQFEFLAERFADYVSAADVVITRGGIGSLSEFACAQKPMIVVPIPKSPQEKNAEYFESKGGALWRHQDRYISQDLMSDIASILKPARYKTMQHALEAIIPRDAASCIVAVLKSII
ncbi:MAG: UDP-N-acetylglucosamine--N-acetylmuramyl-(pentapeptide) pyrophosphoryl-undecaprenol N-acetylglucosamine transferase [Patescibacteria group bacterium]